MASLRSVASFLLASVVAGDDASIKLSNGVVMPRVSAGTWQYNDTLASATVEMALKVGFKHIDTAYDYDNQRGVSSGLAASKVAREEVFVTSKIPGCGVQGLGADDCYGNTLKLIQEDISMLNSAYPTKYLDLILVHFPPCVAGDRSVCMAKRNGCIDKDNCAGVGQQWRAVQEAYERKLVRAVGVSNYCSACFDCLPKDGVQPMINQVQFHVGMSADPQGFASRAKKQGIVLQAWSPLGSGGHGNKEILSGNLTSSIAKAHGKSTAQVALKWLVQHGLSVATKSSNEKHLSENLDVFDWELSQEEMRALDAADFNIHDTPSFMCDDVAPSSQVVV